jgi:hypothetical protein
MVAGIYEHLSGVVQLALSSRLRSTHRENVQQCVTGRRGAPNCMEQINEQHAHRGDWLREIVFGLNDGLDITLVFIMAVSEVAPGRLLLVVIGEVLAGGISMALGGYISARTAKQILDQRIAKERYEIEHEPEEERAELVSIYQNKGFTGPLLPRLCTFWGKEPDMKTS